MLRHQIGLLVTTVFVSVAVGSVWPEPFSYLGPIMAPGLMIILFLSFLKVFPQDVWAALKIYPARLGLLVVIKLIILPVGVYTLALWLVPDYALGLLLLAGTSTAVASPFLTQIVGGNVAFVLVMAVTTTILVPFSLPAVVGVLAGEEVGFDPLTMIRTLALLVFAPLAAAGVIRRVRPLLAVWLAERSFQVSLPLIAAITLAVFGLYAPMLRANLNELVVAVALDALLCALLAVVGAGLLWKSPLPDRIASIASLAFINDVLIVILAIQIDQPRAAVMAALNTFPFFGLMLVLGRMRR